MKNKSLERELIPGLLPATEKTKLFIGILREPCQNFRVPFYETLSGGYLRCVENENENYTYCYQDGAEKERC